MGNSSNRQQKRSRASDAAEKVSIPDDERNKRRRTSDVQVHPKIPLLKGSPIPRCQTSAISSAHETPGSEQTLAQATMRTPVAVISIDWQSWRQNSQAQDLRAMIPHRGIMRKNQRFRENRTSLLRKIAFLKQNARLGRHTRSDQK